MSIYIKYKDIVAEMQKTFKPRSRRKLASKRNKSPGTRSAEHQ